MMPSRGGIQQKGIDSCVLFSHEFRFFFFLLVVRGKEERDNKCCSCGESLNLLCSHFMLPKSIAYELVRPCKITHLVPHSTWAYRLRTSSF